LQLDDYYVVGSKMRQLVVRVVFYFAWGEVLGATLDGSSLSSTELLELGDKAFGQNDVESAIKQYKLGIQSLSDAIPLQDTLSLYTHLGSAQSFLGENEEAVAAYRRAILLHSDTVDSLGDDEDAKCDVTNQAAQAAYYLGMVHQNANNFEQSADAYALANSLDPLHWASVANLGAVLQDDMNQHADALAAYNKAYEILTKKDAQPTDPPEDVRGVLSQIQYRTGLAISSGMGGRRCALQDDPTKTVPCEEMAKHALSLAIQYDSSNEKARHMLASLTADATMSRATNEYVSDLFNGYAKNFEHSLVDELGYNGFERLRRGFDRVFDGSSKVPMFDVVIDAGSGTGLAGEQFRNVSKTLIGVDLSELIMKEGQALRPDLYDDLVVGDVVETFRDRKPIDLIVASDSFIYFGDLAPVFEAMREGLVDGGYCAFSLENISEEYQVSLDKAKPDWRWQLTPSGRFAHRKQYVETVATQYSMDVVRYETLDAFRHEKGEGVRGHLFVLRKAAKDKEL
jgi:predicted TPR repeat methyltransferase